MAGKAEADIAHHPRATTERAAGVARPSRLRAEIGARILRLMKEQGAGRGRHLVESELCEALDVSRSPLRGALKLLAEQGSVEHRPNRGYVLIEAVTVSPLTEALSPRDEAEQQMMVAIARAHMAGTLPVQASTQQLSRVFRVSSAIAERVMRRMAGLGLAERKAGNSWTFARLLDSPSAEQESYRLRRAVEPALVLQDTFKLDMKWARETRRRHMEFRRRSWRDFRAVEFYEMNSDFHEQLARCSGNRYLLDAVQRQIQLRSFTNYHWESGAARVFASIDEHMQILDALEDGDNRLAADHMVSHLAASAQFIPAASMKKKQN